LTITYDSQSGSAISSGSTTTGGSISSSPGTPTRSGYTFNGWFTAASGGSAISFAYVHGQTANFTLYAQWTATTLTITYDSQSGSAISSGSTTTGGSISSSPGTPTRSGYTFNGWFTAASGGSAISFAYVHGQTANFTLYAQWTAATCANGGVCVVGNTGPGGGTVFYVAPTTFTQTNASGTMCTTACKYLEYAPLNWGTTLSAINGCTAGTATTDPKCKYVLTSLTITTPVTSTAIGAGYNNTLLIFASNSSPAATAASSYRGSGFTDWFLPSANELFELCKYATVGGTSCSGGTNGQTTFRTVVRSEFTSTNDSGNLAQYWTSSRSSNVSTAYFGNWRYRSTSATDNNLGQDQALHMRAVRAFG
jgi:uncharacterized repeat protein (TIGR02543 family)